MRKVLLLASAVMAGIVLAPQSQAAISLQTLDQITGCEKLPQARSASRKLRHRGFWGFGKARIRGDHLFLQAYLGRGIPVMIKVDLVSGRVVTVKEFSMRHVRSTISVPDYSLVHRLK